MTPEEIEDARWLFCVIYFLVGWPQVIYSAMHTFRPVLLILSNSIIFVLPEVGEGQARGVVRVLTVNWIPQIAVFHIKYHDLVNEYTYCTHYKCSVKIYLFLLAFSFCREKLGVIMKDQIEEGSSTRKIPNPIQTFEDAFQDYRKSAVMPVTSIVSCSGFPIDIRHSLNCSRLWRESA